MEAKHRIKCRLTFIEEVLGSASNNPNIHDEFIASKAPDAASRAEEVAALGVGEVIEKGMTVFPRNDAGEPALFDYQIKGFFKDSTAALRKVTGTKASKVKAYKKEIDGLLFIHPRMITFQRTGPVGECQRPLRAQTAQGERIALAHSETVPAGSTVEFEIMAFTDEMAALARECLDYGAFRGIGQWRNSGKGRFEWEEIS